jgi:hypothetical protein
MRNAEDRGFFEAMIGDGRPLLVLTGLALIFSGGFALFQSATGQFLPHDVQYLGMTAQDLCRLDQCRIVHFMFHDRVTAVIFLIGLALCFGPMTSTKMGGRNPLVLSTV